MPNRWDIRIVEFRRECPASEFLDHGKNWRIHPEAQKRGVVKILDRVGKVAPLLAYHSEEHEGLTLYNGHLRKNLNPDETWPVAIADLTDEEAKFVIMTLDPSTGMADIDYDILEGLVEDIGPQEEDIAAILETLDVGFPLDGLVDGEVDDLNEIPEKLPGTQSLKPNAHFDSDLPWDIPMLLPEMLAEIPQPLDTWAGPDVCEDDQITRWVYNWGSDSARGLPLDRTLLAFYVDDYRFENFWVSPHIYIAKVLNAGIPVSIAPNFSLWEGGARAMHLYNIFRSRWLGRYMQESGIKVIPDVNWANKESFAFCLIGIPEEPPAIAVQLQTVKKKDKAEIARASNGLRTALDVLRPKSLLVYGGPTSDLILEKVQPECEIVFVLNRVAKRRGTMDSKKEEVIR